MFAPGDEVVCVDDRPILPDEIHPRIIRSDILVRAGEHYVVRWAGVHDGCVTGPAYCVRLVGIVRPGAIHHDPPLRAERFRPVKRESIAVFREMCTMISSGRTLVRVGE